MGVRSAVRWLCRKFGNCLSGPEHDILDLRAARILDDPEGRQAK